MKKGNMLKGLMIFSVFNLVIVLVTLPVYNCGSDITLPGSDDTTQAGNNNGYVTYWAETTDGGLSWDPLDSNYGSVNIKEIYAGVKITSQSGVFMMGGLDTLDRTAIWRSTDYGDTWNLVFNSAENDPIVKMKMNSVNNSILAVTLYGDVYRSADLGSTWQAVNIGNFIYDFDYFENSGRWIAVGGYGTAVYSDNSGATWLPGAVNIPIAFHEVCCVHNSSVAVAMAPTALYRSTDGGLNYLNNFNPVNATDISISANGNGLMVTSVANPPYYTTTDTGSTWISAPVSASAFEFNDIVMINNNLCLGTRENGIVYSTNMGQSWNPTGILKKMYEINRQDHSSNYVFVLGE